KICHNFGVKQFFARLDGSAVDAAFSDDKAEMDTVKRVLLKHVTEGVETYPYKLDPSGFAIRSGGPFRKGRSLWQEFLDQLLRDRHVIAHGWSPENSLSIDEIRELQGKLQVLQYIFLLMLCDSCGRTAAIAPSVSEGATSDT